MPKPSCAVEGRCSGCALQRGAKANSEPDNRLTGLLCALGGVPFQCHERLGWTPDREGEGYPVSKERIIAAVDNLTVAGKLIYNTPELSEVLSDATPTGMNPDTFLEDRAIVGRAPMCEGWKAAVKKLADRGWFRDKDKRNLRRSLARQGIASLNLAKAEKNRARREEHLENIRTALLALNAEQHKEFGELLDLEGDPR